MTKQYGVPSTQSPVVANVAVPTPTTQNQLLPAQAQENPPETIKKLKFIIRPMANVAGYSDEPYKLYADGNLLQKGITDDEGALYFNYIPSVKKYEVELINGHRFTLELDDQIEQLTEADRLGLEGYSSFEYDSHHENKLPKQTDYRRKANNPTWQPDTLQTTDEKDV